MTTDVKETKSKKSKRATNADLAKRMALITKYLDNLSIDTEHPPYFESEEWKLIQNNGIMINQLHRAMCGSLTNSNDLGVLGEKLTIENFKRLLRTNGYEWDPYVKSPFSKCV